MVFLPPALLDAGHYNFAFKSLMALCGLAAIFFVALTLARIGAAAGRIRAVALLVALAPAALGPISLNTYDAWPAALTVAALALLLGGGVLLPFALLALAVSAKVYPLVVLPLAAVYVWRQAGARRLRDALLVFTGVCAAVTAPLALLAPGGVLDSFEAQAARSLQIESLGSAILLAGHRLGIYEVTVVRGSTEALSRDLGGALPDALAFASTAVQLAAVVAVWALYARGRDEPARLVLAFAAAVAGFVAFTKFLSPQYLVWLLPLVPLVGGPAGLVASGLLLIALVLAQLWFFHYGEVFELVEIVWLVIVRDLALLALFAVLLVVLVRATRRFSRSA